MDIKPTDIKPTDIKPTEIKPTEIKPTNIEPTDIKPTDIKPTDIKPTDIKPTDIKPTDIKPTDISSSKIEPTNIQPTDISTNKNTKGTPKAFNGKLVATYLVLALACGLTTLIIGVMFGLSWNLLPVILGTILSLVMFFTELKKLKITQENLDEWNNEILKKHLNFNKSNLVKIEDVEKGLNRMSYWTHTIKYPVFKIAAWLTLAFSVASLGVGIVLPLTTGGGFSGGGNVVGTYVQAQPHETRNNIAQVGRTAWRFDSNGNAYFTGYYSGNNSAWDSSFGKYKKSGSRVTITGIPGAYFTIKDGGKKLVDSDGGYWIKV